MESRECCRERSQRGGGLLQAGDVLTLDQAAIDGNRAFGGSGSTAGAAGFGALGGGVYFLGGEGSLLTIDNSTIANNTALGGSGANGPYASASGPGASGLGGGVYAGGVGGTVQVAYCDIRNNTAQGEGGGVGHNAPSQIADGQAGDNGGAGSSGGNGQGGGIWIDSHDVNNHCDRVVVEHSEGRQWGQWGKRWQGRRQSGW